MNGKKVSVQLLGAALAGITVWAVHVWTKVVIPAEVAVAFGTVYSVVASLLLPDEKEAE